MNHYDFRKASSHGHDLQLPDRGFEYRILDGMYGICNIEEKNERSEIGHTKNVRLSVLYNTVASR